MIPDLPDKLTLQLCVANVIISVLLTLIVWHIIKHALWGSFIYLATHTSAFQRIEQDLLESD